MSTPTAEFLTLMGPEPFDLLTRVRETSPVVPIAFPDGLDRHLVTRHEDVRQVLADPRFSSDLSESVALLQGPTAPVLRKFQDLLGRSMLNVDPPDHTRLRKLVVRAFSAKRVDALRPRITELAGQLLDQVAGQSEIDLVADFSFPLPVLVICELLGVPPEDRAHFSALSHQMLAYLGSERAIREAQAGIDGLVAYMSGLIEAKRAAPADDLISDLIAISEDGDRLAPDELVAMGVLLLNAGHETTVNLIGNGVVLLLQRPDVLARLREEPALVAAAVEEFLRLDGPVHPGLVRRATVDAEIGGVPVAAGTFVLLGTSAANRDPRRFANPDEIDLDRADNPHLAFGYGIHFCLGARLARLESEIAFNALLARYPKLELAVPVAELRRRPGALLRGFDSVPLRVGG
ncbi:cytochrome P450 [Crossiella sp. SN42]|uniref:cytochrome P450 family protein n=1 Tax=Crossiella sp. SN42 TaxID=2944808 RepID=UPI00207C90CD|nr:cytochrome P450 [Crossiella sp. SN42]MCO1578108.1 cytochrome P450 [Crossiella sp. SN42]